MSSRLKKHLEFKARIAIATSLMGVSKNYSETVAVSNLQEEHTRYVYSGLKYLFMF